MAIGWDWAEEKKTKEKTKKEEKKVSLLNDWGDIDDKESEE
jgi:hypothetical protein